MIFFYKQLQFLVSTWIAYILVKNEYWICLASSIIIKQNNFLMQFLLKVNTDQLLI